MDSPDIMSPLHHSNDSFYRTAFAAEKDYSNAVHAAVKLHCQGKTVPDDIARFCRCLAVNLDRDLARGRGETPPPMPGRLDDYTKS